MAAQAQGGADGIDWMPVDDGVQWEPVASFHAGMLEPGNIDLTKRPVVRNADGTISTVRSMSANFDGREMLIPTVSDDGRVLSDDDAAELYRRTGRHLGAFATPEAATTYAERLHDDQASMYGAGDDGVEWEPVGAEGDDIDWEPTDQRSGYGLMSGLGRVLKSQFMSQPGVALFDKATGNLGSDVATLGAGGAVAGTGRAIEGVERLAAEPYRAARDEAGFLSSIMQSLSVPGPAGVHGLPGAMRGAAMAAEDQPAYQPSGLSQAIRSSGERMASDVTPQMQQAMEGSQIGGDFFDPSTYTLGKNPSARGLLGHVAKVGGEMAPIVGAGFVNPGLAVATAAGQSAGGAYEENADYVMKLTPEKLANVPRYRELIDRGVDAQRARAIVADEAGRGSMLPAAAIGAGSGVILSGAATGPLSRAMAARYGDRFGTRLGANALEMPLEGAQEVAEAAAGRAGANQASGMDRSLTEDTFGDFVLGAAAAGPAAVLHSATGSIEQDDGIDWSPTDSQPVPLPASANAGIRPGNGVRLDDQPTPVLADHRPMSTGDLAEAAQRRTAELEVIPEPTLFQREELDLLRNGDEATRARVLGIGSQGVDAAPTVQAPSEPVLDPDVRSRQRHDSNIQAFARRHGLTDAQAQAAREELGAPLPRDPVTNFHRAEERDELVRAAQAHARDSGERADYFEVDLRNLGGLNAARGHSGANAIYRQIADIVRGELEAVGSEVVPVRHGGDEFSGVVRGSDGNRIGAALARARNRVDDLIREEGLDAIPHPKGGAPGVGIYAAHTTLDPDEGLRDLYGSVDRRIEDQKKEVRHGYGETEAARLGSSDARAAGAGAQQAGLGAVAAPGGREGAARADVPSQPSAQPGQDPQAGIGIQPPSGLVNAAATTPRAKLRLNRPGRIGTAYTSNNQPIEFRYALIEADELTLSNTPDGAVNPAFPQELQPRDRTTTESRAQVSAIAGNLQPERLGESGDIVNGAPLVGPDGIVESGNGRVMALTSAPADRKAAYRKWLADNASTFGVGAKATDGMRNPVLVRVRQGNLDTADRARLGQEGNPGTQPATSPVEAAHPSARVIDDDMTDLRTDPTEGQNELSDALTMLSRASTIEAEDDAQGISVAAAQRAVDAFIAGYNGNVPLEVRVVGRQEELYGPTATPDRVGRLKGAYHGKSGVLGLVAGHLRSETDARETLRHEILGHYGINTLAPDDKRALLARIVGARTSEGLPSLGMRKLWATVDRNYSDKSELERAEEVFALAAEKEQGTLGNVWDDIVAFAMDALRRVGLIPKSITAAEVRGIVRRIAAGIRDGSSRQRTHPGSDDAQFQRDSDEPQRKTPKFNSAAEWWTDHVGSKVHNAITHATKKVLAHDILKRHGLNLAEDLPPEAQAAWREYRKRIGNLQRTVAEIGREAATLTPEERAQVSDYIEHEMKAGVTPPENVERMAVLMTSIMRKQSAELVELGMLSEESRDRWDGRYLPRFYAKNLLTSPFIRELRHTFMQSIKGSHLKGRGLFEQVAVEDVPAYEKMGWELRDDAGRQVSTQGLGKGATVRMWRDFTPAEREKMGEVRDAMFRFARGYSETQTDIARGRLFEHIAKTLAQKQNPGGAWIQVPDTSIEGTGLKKFGMLAGMWVPGDVLSELKAKTVPDNPLIKAYLKGLSLWKEGKTALNPVTHANNIVSNVMMADLAGVNVFDPRSHKLYADTFFDFRRKGPIFKAAQEAGLFGGEWYGNEVGQWLPTPGEFQGIGVSATILGRFADRALNLAKLGREKMGRAYQAEDQFFKLLLFSQARQRGLDSDDAVVWAERFVFDYSTAAPGVRKLKNGPYPFFNYTAKAVPALVFAATHYPWRVAKWIGILGGINLYAFNSLYGAASQLLGGLFGDDDDEVRKAMVAEAALLPEYLRGQSSFYGVPKAIRLPFNDESTGAGQYVDISRFVPLGDMFDMNNQMGGAPLPAPLMPNNPLISITLGMLGNKDSFTGKDIVRESDTGGEAAQKRLAWIYRQMAPNNPLIPGTHNFNRLAEATAATAGEPIGPYTGLDYNGATISPARAIAQTFGVKIRTVDFQREHQWQVRGLQNEIEDLNSQITQLNRNQSISATTREREQAKLRAKIEVTRLRLEALHEVDVP